MNNRRPYHLGLKAGGRSALSGWPSNVIVTCTASSSREVVTARTLGRQPQHARVARQDLRDEPAHAAADGVLLEAALQGGAEASALPFRRHHERDLGEIGRGVQEVAAAADDHLVLARPGHRQERDLRLVVHVAERLQLLEGQRAHAPEEPGVDVVRRQAVEQRPQCIRIGGARRPDQDIGAVLELTLRSSCTG